MKIYLVKEKLISEGEVYIIAAYTTKEVAQKYVNWANDYYHSFAYEVEEIELEETWDYPY